MDQRAADFAAQLMATFKVEAEEHLKGLSDGLLALEKQPSADERKEIVETVFREAHSLKGAARAVDMVKVESICQAMEDLLSGLKQGMLQLSPELLNTLYATIDLIGKCVADPKIDDEGMLKVLAEKLNSPAGETTPKLSTSDPIPEIQNVAAKKAVENSEITHTKTIRVTATKLDLLMQEVEEMLLIKLITGQRYNHIKQLLSLFSNWEKSWMLAKKDLRQMRLAKESDSGNYTPSHEFLNFLEQQPTKVKEIRDDLQAMTKVSAQDSRLAGSMVDGLLEDTKKVLMQPFSSLFDAFPRMVRDISHSLDKKINLQIAGGDIEVDRRILEEMKDPLIHLIRNSIDHGIEGAEERQKLKKSIEGTIKLSATQKSGNQVEIILSDDGKGINIQAVKDSAIKNGLISQREAEEMSVSDSLMLIFKSGLSTSPIITELSGRGLGMGIVLEKVEKLGGHLTVESKPNIGTTFKITLPLTLATFRGVHVIAWGQDFIFPTHNLTRVLRITEGDIQTVEGKQTFNLNGRVLSYVNLGEVLELPMQKKAAVDKYLYALIIKAMDITVAIGVDAILNEQQVFVKGLGKQLVRVRNIAAATVMEWGKVVPILDPFDLVKSISKTTTSFVRKAVEEKKQEKKTILVVEDSVTARVLLKNILETSGYEVKTAVDGLEALSILKVEDVELLLSDVDMPRMNGFKLTESVRAIEKFKDLPIILCTSRGSREDREHGIEVGANAYIDKSTFTQSYLLEIIQKFF